MISFALLFPAAMGPPCSTTNRASALSQVPQAHESLTGIRQNKHLQDRAEMSPLQDTPRAAQEGCPKGLQGAKAEPHTPLLTNLQKGTLHDAAPR